MMMRKKIGSMLLALCFTLGLVMSAVPAASASDIVDRQNITVSSARVKSGDSVQVTVSLENNPGIQSMKLAVHYDPSVLTLTSASIDDAFRNVDGAMAIENIESQPAVLNWITFGATDCTLNGTFATLTFQALDTGLDTGGGNYAESAVQISYDDEDIFNSKEQNVPFGTTTGVVEVIPYLPGDINGDGDINNKDLTALFRYLAGVEGNVVEAALDVNGDGNRNNKDLTRLFQYLSGADVTIY